MHKCKCIPRRSSKSDLLALYTSLQSGEPSNSSPPPKTATKAIKGRKSPYSRPGPIFTPSRTGLRPSSRSSRPSASLGLRAPDAAAPTFLEPPPSPPPFLSCFHHPIHPQRSIPSPFPNSPTPPQESPPAVFPHCRSSARFSRSLLYISPLPQQCPLQQEPSLYFSTAAAVPAPAGAFSVFPHCRSSARSSRSLFCISPLPQECPLQQEPFLYFPTAAAVPAPAGAFFCISPLPQQCPLQQEPFLYFPAAAAVPAPAGAFSIFPRCHSSTRSSRSPFHISPLPEQCPLQQEPFLYFPAPAGVFSIFPHCRSSVRSHRIPFYISPLPQQCPLPQDPFLYFPTAAAVSTPTFSIPPRCHSSTRFSRSLSSLLDATAALLQAVSSIPSTLSHAIFGGLFATIRQLSRD